MRHDHDDLERLMARVALRDRAAFRRVYELTSAHLLSVAFRVLKRRELAEDVLQEVYVRLWSRAHEYDAAIARPMSWLITIVRHRAIDLLRARRSDPNGDAAAPLGAEHDDEAMQLHDAGAAAGLAERAFDQARVGACMHALSAVQRQCLALAYYHGLTQLEVAARLQVPLGSVKVWVRRGLDRLRRCLEAARSDGLRAQRVA